MQANIPRGWHRLPPSEKKAISDYLQAEIFKKGGFPDGFFEKLIGPVEKGADNEQREAD